MSLFNQYISSHQEAYSLLNQLLSIQGNPENFANEFYTELVSKLTLKRDVFLQKFVSQFNEAYTDLLFQMQDSKDTCSDKIKLAIDEFLTANFSLNKRSLTVFGIKKILNKIKSIANETFIEELNTLNTNFEIDAEFVKGDFIVKPIELFNIQIQKLLNLENIRQIGILKRHFGEIYKLTKISNKNQILSASMDNSIKLWDLNKMKCLWTLNLNRPEFAVFENRIICAENEGSIKIFDLENGKCVKTSTNISLEVSCILVVNEKKFLTGLLNGEILLWNMINFKICDSISGHLMKVTDLKMLNKTSFISSSWDKDINLWHFEKNKAIRTFKGHKDWVTCLELFNENEFISGSRDGTIKIWHKNLNCCVETLNGHMSGINEIKVFDYYQLMSCSDDGTIKHWDSIQAVCLKTVKISDQFCISNFIVMENGIMITAENKEIKIWI